MESTVEIRDCLLFTDKNYDIEGAIRVASRAGKVDIVNNTFRGFNRCVVVEDSDWDGSSRMSGMTLAEILIQDNTFIDDDRKRKYSVFTHHIGVELPGSQEQITLIGNQYFQSGFEEEATDSNRLREPDFDDDYCPQ